ncbi:lipase [Rhodococcus sp. D2-41]|uniref:Lipase family protein n=1 Tax=Speluncibacter jeojiensis TaxID=2710754 RepID=A0A9X4M7Y2_9ACTN|nr:lipase [Rhodococcus sp. D2-41]MDG3009434.1 lipase [Rhodococcus sp. D2-41]MDG3016938.1 lipase family protein [Corynebacteriales bacterium D3-21]
MRRSLAAVVVAIASAMVALIASTGAAAAPLPVPHNFYDGIGAEAADPGGSLPGSNDWSCKPTAEHPQPVVLVHGLLANRQSNWTTYVPLLKNEGYCVYSITWGTLPGLSWPLSTMGALTPMEVGAQQLSVFVDRVLASTGADKVDIVSHSTGTLMPDYYVKFLGGAPKVDKYVALTPLWRGNHAAFAAESVEITKRFGLTQMQQQTFGKVCASCLEMAAGSDYIAKINEGGSPYVPGVTYTNIATKYDELVVPYTAGLVPGPNVTNIVVQDHCPTDYSEHAAMGASPVAAGYVLNALDPQHPRPVPCMVVSPFTGTPIG